jgi:hypothetical protein
VQALTAQHGATSTNGNGSAPTSDTPHAAPDTDDAPHTNGADPTDHRNDVAELGSADDLGQTARRRRRSDRASTNGPRSANALRPADRRDPGAPEAATAASPSIPIVAPRSITDQLGDLFAEATSAPPPASTSSTSTSPAATSPAPPVAPRPSDPDPGVGAGAPERWTVLADVAELADHRPASPTTPPAPSPEPGGPPTQPVDAWAESTEARAAAAPLEEPSGIDLGNFTARGKRVGGGRGKRRRFGR